MNISNPHTARKLAEAGSFAPTSGPLADANIGFHHTYNRSVDETLTKLGTSIPIIIFLGDYLNLLNEGSTQSELAIPYRYHQLKSLSHIAFGVQLSLMNIGNRSLDEITEAELQDKRTQMRRAYAAVPELPADEQSAPTFVLNRSVELVEQVLANQKGSLDFLEEYAKSVAPFLLQNAAFAVRVELDRLHELVSMWRRQIGENKWRDLFVMICDNHQPRYRHAARQYFGRILHEQEGIAAEREDRIVFGEGIKDIDGALDLLARHLIDQRASAMLFGDSARLQKDVLADVASEYLNELLPP